MTKAEFIKEFAPYAVEDMKKNGILASVKIAQGILESGYGNTELAKNALNFFGMKCNLSGNTWAGSTWDGVSKYTKVTKEDDGKGNLHDETADFRKYNSIAESIGDHSAYLLGAMKGSEKRYKGLQGEKDPEKAITIIKNGGYATDTKYIKKIMDIIKENDLTKYDVQEETEKGENNDMDIKIMLDAGHYAKYNRSPANGAYYESDMVWKLHLMLKAALEKYGITVLTTRANKDVDRGVYERGKAAAGCNLFLSLHSNAVGSGVNESVDYPVVYVPLNGKGNALGNKLAAVIENTMQTKQNGRIATRAGSSGADYYGVIRGAVAVGVCGMILEHSFHTNTRATNWLLQDSNLQKLAEAEAAVIAEYYGLKKTGNTEQAKPETPTEEKKYYRVRKTWEDAAGQLGAYTELQNAKNKADENKGYYVFDWNGKQVYPEIKAAATVPYMVRVDIDDLRIRKGAGTTFDYWKDNGKARYTGEGAFTIVKEKEGAGASMWGLLKAYEEEENGWISLDYTTKLK